MCYGPTLDNQRRLEQFNTTINFILAPESSVLTGFSYKNKDLDCDGSLISMAQIKQPSQIIL